MLEGISVDFVKSSQSLTINIFISGSRIWAEEADLIAWSWLEMTSLFCNPLSCTQCHWDLFSRIWLGKLLVLPHYILPCSVQSKRWQRRLCEFLGSHQYICSNPRLSHVVEVVPLGITMFIDDLFSIWYAISSSIYFLWMGIKKGKGGTSFWCCSLDSTDRVVNRVIIPLDTKGKCFPLIIILCQTLMANRL